MASSDSESMCGERVRGGAPPRHSQCGTFLMWQPPASYSNHLPHMATTCLIRQPLASYGSHLPNTATTFLIWHPPASYGNHLPHMATTCLISQPPASYGNHLPHMVTTCLIWQPLALYGRRPSARSRRGSTSRAASTSPPPTCHRGASRTVAHASESGCRYFSCNVSSLPHGHRPRVPPALPLRNDFNCYCVTAVPPVPSAGTAGRPRPARRAAQWRRRPGSAPSRHVSTRCRDTAEMQPRYSRDGSSSKTTDGRRDVAYPPQQQHARLRRCHV